MEAYLRTEKIQKSFGKTQVLKDVDISVQKGEFVCILGPSGCGKTTLLRVIAGLEPPNGGKVHIGGRDVTDVPPGKRALGFVFQSFALFPNMTVYDNVAYPLAAHRVPKREIKQRVETILARTHMEDFTKKYPATLSGGQQQRVALARALVMEPVLLLLDEPLSALDAKVREQMREEIRQLQHSMGITTVMVTHDQEEALSMANHVVLMDQGEVVQSGRPEELYFHPNGRFAATFIGNVNILEHHLVRPETIDIVPDEAGECVISDLIFHGASYRAFVDTPRFGKVMVDVPSRVSNAHLKRGARVRLVLPEGVAQDG
nr:ABC transporter ATP-binding protein [Maliibacterium massiliense]